MSGTTKQVACNMILALGCSPILDLMHREPSDEENHSRRSPRDVAREIKMHSESWPRCEMYSTHVAARRLRSAALRSIWMYGLWAHPANHTQPVDFRALILMDLWKPLILHIL